VKTLDLHIDGDVGIGDLVFCRHYWSHHTESRVPRCDFKLRSVLERCLFQCWPTSKSLPCRTGPTIPGRVPMRSAVAMFRRCSPLLTIRRTLVERTASAVQPGCRLTWLTGLYWEKTKEIYSDFYRMPGLQLNGEAAQSAISYYNNLYLPNRPRRFAAAMVQL